MATASGQRGTVRSKPVRRAGVALMLLGLALVTSAIVLFNTHLASASLGLMVIGAPVFALGMVLKWLDWMVVSGAGSEGSWAHHVPGSRKRARSRAHKLDRLGDQILDQTALQAPDHSPDRALDSKPGGSQAELEPVSTPLSEALDAAPASLPNALETAAHHDANTQAAAMLDLELDLEPSANPEHRVPYPVGVDFEIEPHTANLNPVDLPLDLVQPSASLFIQENSAQAAAQAAAPLDLELPSDNADDGASPFSRSALQRLDATRFAALVEKLFQQAGFATRLQPAVAKPLQTGDTVASEVATVLWLFSRHQPGHPASAVLCLHQSQQWLHRSALDQVGALVSQHGLLRGQLITNAEVPDALRAQAAACNVHLLDLGGVQALIGRRNGVQQLALAQRIA